MKLCIISHYYLERGYQPVLETMAASPGVDLAWITPNKVLRDLRFSVTSPAFRSFPLPVRFPGRQGAFVYRARALEQALDEIQPEIILHEQEVYAMGACQIASVAARRSIPLVMFVWENLHRSLALPRRLMRRYVLDRCSGLITGSAQATQVHRDWGFDRAVEVIQAMGARINPAPTFGRRGQKTIKVCFAGRLIRSKGIDILLRAVQILQARNLSVQCRIAGQGPELHNLAALSESLGIKGLVDFCGCLPMEDVAELFRNSDVLVLPSLRTETWEEQFGRVLAEAMAQGTVTVGSRTGAIPEVIASEDLLFQEGDARTLAGILEKLSNDPDFFLASQQLLWKRACDLYDNDLLSARRIHFLQHVLSIGRQHS